MRWSAVRSGRRVEAAPEQDPAHRAGDDEHDQNFIAEFTEHIPDARTRLVRYFGWYSNKNRGMRAKAADDAARDAQSPAPRTPSANAARRRWAALLKRVWHVDPRQIDRALWSFGKFMKTWRFPLA